MTAQQQLILRGLVSIESISDPAKRAELLEAAAYLITDEELSNRCRATAACLREAEAAQGRLFNSIRTEKP